MRTMKKIYNAAATITLTLACLLLTSTSQGALIGHWTFDDDLTDGKFADSVGTNHGTAGSSISQNTTTKAVGTGSMFDTAISAAGDVNLNTAIGLSGTWTVSLWYNVSSVNLEHLIGHTTGSDKNSIRLETNRLTYMFSNSNRAFTSHVPTTNEWRHIVVTDSGGNVTLYGDGATSETQTMTTSWTLSLFGGGNGIGNNRNLQNGYLDDIAYWDNALTQAEAFGLHNFVAAGLDYDAGKLQGLYTWADGASAGESFDVGGTTWYYRDDLTPSTDGDMTFDGTDYFFTYDAGSSIVLTTAAAAVPEPSTFALAAGLLGLGFVGWRRRRRRF